MPIVKLGVQWKSYGVNKNNCAAFCSLADGGNGDAFMNPRGDRKSACRSPCNPA